MAGLFGRLIMAGMKRNKAQNTKYIPRDYEQSRRNQDIVLPDGATQVAMAGACRYEH